MRTKIHYSAIRIFLPFWNIGLVYSMPPLFKKYYFKFNSMYSADNLDPAVFDLSKIQKSPFPLTFAGAHEHPVLMRMKLRNNNKHVLSDPGKYYFVTYIFI